MLFCTYIYFTDDMQEDRMPRPWEAKPFACHLG